MNRKLISIAILTALIATLILNTIATATVASSGRLSGMVWMDDNRNGIHEPFETGAGRLPLYLQPVSNGEVVGTGGLAVWTDENGTFNFENVAYGQYEIRLDSGESQTVTVSEVNSAPYIEIAMQPATPDAGRLGSEMKVQIFLPIINR